MKVCNKCILTDAYPRLSFDEEGTCSLCSSHHVFKPYGEDKLLQIIASAKRKKTKEYDALVPLSGGKDSTYILHLAVNVYKLKVLAMTYDNGFVSQIALDNMRRAVDIANVKLIVCKPDLEVLKKVYKNMLLRSGDFCGACGIAIKANIFKVAHEYGIPMILLGTSPLEEDSFLPDTTQDVERFKYIMGESKCLNRKQLKDFLIYPDMNYLKMFLYKRIGYFAKEVCPLFYIKNPSDMEMGEIISNKLGWKDDNTHEYSKHFDCWAEPFTNYVRQKIYGYERHICQYSTMIRRGEISREKALEMYEKDETGKKPNNYDSVIKALGISESEMAEMLDNVKPLKYEDKVSSANKLYIKLMNLLRNK